MANQIPMDIDVTSGILSNLSVKDLLRFKTVSKEWCSLIDDRYLINLHRRQSIQNRNNLNIIGSDLESGRLYFMGFDPANVINPIEINQPSLHDPERDRDLIEVLGSCNGLLCITSNFRTILLWNILTGHYRVLPENQLVTSYNFYECSYGFGYDSINDDYKVVKIVQKIDRIQESYTSEVIVYSLKENKWRRSAEEITYEICSYNPHGMSSTFVNGALHWVAIKEALEWDSINIIIALDVQTEKHRQIELLEDMQRGKTDHAILASLQGCLCACLNNSRSRAVNVWMMKEYGAKESWTILCRLEESWSYFRSLKPWEYSKKGDKLLLVERKSSKASLLWYDLKERKLNNIDFPYQLKNITWFRVEICMESLVQLGKQD